MELKILDKDREVVTRAFDILRGMEQAHVFSLLEIRHELKEQSVEEPKELSAELHRHIGYWDAMMTYAALMSKELEETK